MRKFVYLRANIALGLIFAFLINALGPIPTVFAEPVGGIEGEFHLPAPGILVPLSSTFKPPILKGIKVHPENPFRFDFILDRGDNRLKGRSLRDSSPSPQNDGALKAQATKLIKYFLASLTIPEKDLWVNLSPYEKDRIIPASFGQTEMGRDLLAEDYMLKQITASLIYPEGETGKKFWKRIYREAAKRFGTTNVPVNTFNKVWIVPEKAVVYENVRKGTAYIVESKLKVMLEQDYLSLEKHTKTGFPTKTFGNDRVSMLGSQIIREIVIPELNREVNTAKNFAQLRQVYNSLILATWYKKKIKESILAQVYENKNKISGIKLISSPLSLTSDQIYQGYLQAFKKGAYNYIKEEINPITQQVLPRKYFSGGAFFGKVAINFVSNLPQLKQETIMRVKTDFAMAETEPSIDLLKSIKRENSKNTFSLYAMLERLAKNGMSWTKWSNGYNKYAQRRSVLGPNRDLERTFQVIANTDDLELRKRRVLSVKLFFEDYVNIDKAMTSEELEGLVRTKNENIDVQLLILDLRAQLQVIQEVRAKVVSPVQIKETQDKEENFRNTYHLVLPQEEKKITVADNFNTLKDLRSKRDKLYEQIRDADKQNDLSLLQRLNIRAIELNRQILGIQLALGWFIFEPGASKMSWQVRYNMVRQILEGAYFSARAFEDELDFRIKRLQGALKIYHFERFDVIGQLVRTYRLGSIKIPVSLLGKDGQRTDIVLYQKKWLNSSFPNSMATVLARGRLGAQSVQFRKLIADMSSNLNVMMVLMRFKANLEYYDSKLEDPATGQYFAKYFMESIRYGESLINKWASPDYPYSPDKEALRREADIFLSYLNSRSPQYDKAREGLSTMIAHLSSILFRLENANISYKAHAWSIYARFRDEDIDRRINELKTLLQGKDLGHVKSKLEEMEGLYFSFPQAELGYQRAIQTLTYINSLLSPKSLERMKEELGQMQADIEHKNRLRLRINYNAKKWDVFSFQNTTVARLLTRLNIDPNTVQVSVDSTLIQRDAWSKTILQELSRVEIKDKAMNTRNVLQRFDLVPEKVIYDERENLQKIKSDALRVTVEKTIQQIQDRLNGLNFDEGDIILQLLGEGKEDVSSLLVYLDSILRESFSYKTVDPLLTPLRSGIVHQRFFRIGDHLFVSPDTEGFRRHFIFKTDDEGRVLFAYELMIPGKKQSRMGHEGIHRSEVAYEVNDEWGDNFSANILFTGRLKYNGPPLYNKFKVNEVEISVYDYTFDGKRFTNITKKTRAAWAKELGVPAEDWEMGLLKVALGRLMSVSVLGYLGHGDDHLENVRAGPIYSEDRTSFKVQLVADFEGYQKYWEPSESFFYWMAFSLPMSNFLEWVSTVIFSGAFLYSYNKFLIHPMIRHAGDYYNQFSPWQRFKILLEVKKEIKKKMELRRSVKADTNAAMGSGFRRGGIDMTSGSPTQAFGDDKQGIIFHIDPAQLAQWQHAPGFVPVIIDIEPLVDLKGFLGSPVVKA